MLNKFHPKNAVTFKLNGELYLLHRYILDKLDIFKVVDDCPDQMIELTWDITPENAETFFSILDDENNYIDFDGNISKCLQTISFAKYMGAPDHIIEPMTHNLLYADFVNYLYGCCSAPFSKDIERMSNQKRIDINSKNMKGIDAKVLILMVKSCDNFDRDFKLNTITAIFDYDIERVTRLNGWEIKFDCNSAQICNIHPQCVGCSIGRKSEDNNIFIYYGIIDTMTIHLRNINELGTVSTWKKITIVLEKCHKEEKYVIPLRRRLADHFSKVTLDIKIDE
uniref:Uncharacterized protein n=1 Tax=viral metagenome TaxID=1070528 RepID=A0A6C0C7P9_9ZZZZ